MKRNYIRSFDGIRTFALIGVICYHILPGTFKGGYLGVVLFFVLSGYLITDLLLYEFEKSGKISAKKFYIRRLKRLYPAMLTVLLGTALYMGVFQRNMLNQMRMVFISSLLSFNNWWQVFKGGSYFNHLLAEAPFQHFYSLSIEAQYYFIWPIIVYFLLLFIKKRDKIFMGLTIAGLLSALAMAVLYSSGQDPTRVYYGTDTRLFSILMGSSLAFVWPSHRLKSVQLPKEWQLKLSLFSVFILVSLVAMMFILPGQHWFVYRGGMWVYSLFALVLVAIAAHPDWLLGKCFSNPVFDYFGKRSYEIYLWQTPVFAFMEVRIREPKAILSILLQLGVILLLSELYRKPLKKSHPKIFPIKLKIYFVNKRFFNQKVVILNGLRYGFGGTIDRNDSTISKTRGRFNLKGY